MRGRPGFFDIDDRLKRLSDLGDQLETLRSAVDFELFRPELNAALSYTERTEGGRPNALGAPAMATIIQGWWQTRKPAAFTQIDRRLRPRSRQQEFGTPAFPCA